MIILFLILIILLILILVLSKDEWDPATINQFNQPVPAFPKGDSLLTINSEGNLSAQLSDENMNAYFSAIDKKINELVDSYNQNMTSLQTQYQKDLASLQEDLASWKKQADDTYIKENEDIMIANLVDGMAYVYADGTRGAGVHVNNNMSDYGNYPNANIDTPSSGLGFTIKKKSHIGTGITGPNGWRCKNGNLTSKC